MAARISIEGPVLVTGVAGFIGYHLARRVLEDGGAVVGADNLNGYYDPALKHERLARLAAFPAFSFEKVELADRDQVGGLFASGGFPAVIHLAAQAGVRHSLIDPHSYVDSNLVGFLNVLEGCRRTGCRHLLYASSSSVYGGNTSIPSRTSDNVDHPLNLYGATKKANELMAHAYAHLFALPTTGLRFFTVYGPWGRPDMAIWLFSQAIATGKPLRLFNYGNMRRDFTYIDDVTEAIVRLIPKPPPFNPNLSMVTLNAATSFAPWQIFNIGNSTPVALADVVRVLEHAIGRNAVLELMPMQPGDILETCADVADLQAAIGFSPKITIVEGVRRFIEWYRDHNVI